MSEALHVVILAAGEGKRMNSAQPKVLLPVAGRPMLAQVLAAARELGAAAIHVVYGHRGEQVRAAFAGDGDLRWVEQAEQLGTGHAVQQAMPAIPDDARVLVLYGDVPLIEAETLRRVLSAPGALAVLGAEPADPTGYGRLLLDSRGRVQAIVEHRDCDERQRAIGLINTGIIAAQAGRAAPLAVAPGQRQRAGRVLPHRRIRHGRGGGRAGHGRARRRRAWRPRAPTTPRSSPRSSAPGSSAPRAG